MVSSRSPPGHREPRVPGLADLLQQVADGVLGGQRFDFGPRRHELLGGAGAELQRPVDQRGGGLSSSEPCSFELRTSDTSSCGERELNSAAGSMPNRSRIQFAVPLVRWISGVNTVENNTCGPATTRAVASGCATARYCATSSPNTIDTEVAISSASASAIPSNQCAGTLAAVSTGCSSRAISGSAGSR